MENALINICSIAMVDLEGEADEKVFNGDEISERNDCGRVVVGEDLTTGHEPVVPGLNSSVVVTSVCDRKEHSSDENISSEVQFIVTRL